MPSSRSHIKISKFGDWSKVIHSFSSLDLTIGNSVKYGQRKAAKMVYAKVIGHLISQDLNWTPLAPSTVARKGNRRVLLDTRLYFESIKVWSTRGVYSVGVPRGVVNKRGVEVSNIAAIQEFGTDKIPARPLWGPSIQELGGPRGLRDIVAKVLAKRINRKLSGTGLSVSKGLLNRKYSQ